MSESKINGLSTFAREFADFEDEYIVIGGTACYLELKGAGLDFRATKDVDMVITTEKISHEFGKRFWKFIENGGYEIYAKDGEKKFFRFLKPSSLDYPAMIELFARRGEFLPPDKKFKALFIDDELSSLSAILLDDDYYSFLKSGRETVDGISVLKPPHLIAFKIKAYLDLSERKSKGERVDEKNIKKHKNDVFRLARLLTGEEKVVATEKILGDIESFFATIVEEEIDMKQFGIHATKEDVIKIIKGAFGI
ncbi:MAG TPA: hypothetical protein DDY77_01000 [Clostridiales bacterium]|nr:hypothetical protein [Clostridiales bacterium]